MKILGIDYGTKRIGLALSDDRGIIAFPLTALTLVGNIEKRVKELSTYLSTLSFEEVVMGLPLLMNGKDSDMSLEVKAFSLLLEESLGKKIILWDERLTSKQVEKSLIDQDIRRKDRTALVDARAATLILQSYLDVKK